MWGDATQLFGDLKLSTKKNEMKYIGLRWPPMEYKSHNNQQITGECNGEEYGEEMHPEGGASEVLFYHFLQATS
jgi:hypothetical protein